MSGHSKWANIKRHKEKIDAQKGKVFTQIAREIIVAAKQGGGDPEANFRLKAAILRAKEANIPNDNIARAIKKGTGELSGESYEEIMYEGYGPGGVAVLLNILTDNRNRTAGEVRHIFSKCGGNLGESGCVSWLFEQKGLVLVDKSAVDEDTVMLVALDCGAEDFKAEDDESYEIIITPADLEQVRSCLEEKGLPISDANLAMIPKNTVEVCGKEAEQMMKLLDMLDDCEDVQDVWANCDFTDN